MKIRTDFVTNSSSSSFITCSITSVLLGDICRQFGYPLSKSTFCIDEYDSEFDIMPSSLQKGVAEFISFFLEEEGEKALAQAVLSKADEINRSVTKYKVKVNYEITDGGSSYYEYETFENGKLSSKRIYRR